MMNDWKHWVIVLGGVLAIANHWVPGYWLDVIGGVIAAAFALMPE